ncbi:LysR family transcriptional regulator [Nocardioides albidus]|uniref:LysR family transcriptional regulator n=1 Tax=Nocardioides albidus TaxID=1517589 RepID=A0A5C4WF03_9ACTN|nr:LysR family transcriptional regulator [Nocardioides albidus]TNM46116.1 LysR family transcriptional regulator [Nocardioides albidus]
MYELRHLRALDAIAAEGTFARAAQRLGYTQSTLSQQVAALERAVGGAVFDRPGGPRPVRLTPLGRVVLASARDVLEAAGAAEEAVARFHAGDGRVDIGTFQTVTDALLPAVVRRLRERHPGCDIRLVEDEAAEPDLGELDVLFFDRPGPDDADSILLLEDEHVLVASPGAFPAGPVPLDLLHDAPTIALPPICDQREVEEHLAARAVVPRVVFRTADNRAVTSMVRAGLGCAVMPVLSLGWPERPRGVVLHPLEPALPPRRVFALTRGALSPLAEEVVAVASRVAREVRDAGGCRA